MKNTILTLSTLSLMAFTITQKSDFDIVGRWERIDGKEAINFRFDKEGYAYFDAKAFQIGGKAFIIKGKKRSLRYEIDYSKSPLEINVIYQTLDNSEPEKTVFIIKKMNNKKIQIVVLKDNKRPKIIDTNNMHIFARVAR